ncbi:hypothetical protein K7432_008037 [Basidiobolus ranarum]|uniref:Yeast cell wall synthesis Kre9/Knh1-like N-terminal domain-containing protein n=1 Tax=Basidiobolus ranarum TaxID=34480 RepID=A0ABR2VZ80_9FUNG
MVNMLLGFALLASLMSVVLGEIQITSPMNSIFRTGTEAHIEWISSGDSDSLGEIDITLMSGSATRLSLIGTVANNVPIKEGVYLWKIPEGLPPAKDYVLRLGSKQQYFYSTNFEVTDQSGPAYPEVLNARGDTRPKKSAPSTTDKDTNSSDSKKSDTSKPATLSDNQKKPVKTKNSATQISTINLIWAIGVAGALIILI